MRRPLLIALLALATPAGAVVPMPPVPECAEGALDKCPPDLEIDDWEQTSWIPPLARATVRPSELAMGSGLGADVAWRYATGRFSVPVAIIDTGIEWGERSLANKVKINVAEVPFPQGADGQDKGVHDFDANGLVNVRDWAEDPRVPITAGHDDADGFLDPSDLLAAFSDGKDDESNGFVDDIAGWDFFQDDNDPYPHVRDDFSDHGTGVMQDAGAEGGDGGDIGVCPNCAIIPLRSGDGIISDGDRVGLAITYAVDQGARSIGMALGSLSHSTLTDAAIRYADAHGTVLVSVTGDENSYHHNLPSMKSPILYVHSIRRDTREDDVFTYMSFLGCNNFGPRVDLVAGTDACATGSSAKTSGAAGLLISAGLDQGLDLAPDEIRALLRTTVDDVAFSASDLETHETYPAGDGWDGWMGYGRLDVGNAVTAIVNGDIPPVARIQDPDWFTWAGGSVVITGEVAAPRGAVASWTLEVGRGMEPTAWASVASGASAASGTLATVDLGEFGDVAFADLFDESVVERTHRAHEPLVTFRLTVTDGEGRVSQDRRGVWVHDDADRLAAFPITPGGSVEPSPVLADLDGDGDFEVIVATGAGQVHAWQPDGTEIAGFPVHTARRIDPGTYDLSPGFASGEVPGDAPTGMIASPAVGDVDGDGDPEVVAADLRGRVYAWNADGTLLPGFPVALVGRENGEFVEGQAWDRGIIASPALADVDGDGGLELIVAGMDQRIYVWRGDGTLLDGFPLELCDPTTCGEGGRRIVASPAIGDLDGDGALEMVIGTNEVPRGAAGLLYVVELDTASIRDGWPIERDGLINQGILPVIGEGHPSSAALGDLNGDGALEIFANPMLGTYGPVTVDGEPLYDLPFYRDGFGAGTSLTEENSFVPMVNNPGLGDLDGDGVPDLLLGGTGVTYLISLAGTDLVEYQHALGGWSGADGASLPGFPRQVEDVAFLDAPAVADITGDGVPEAIYATGGYFVHAWDKDGNEAPGWPKFTGGWVLGSPTVGDIDGDGFVEVVAATREGAVFAWTTEGRADQDVQWAGMRHDPQNTGNITTALVVQAGPPEVDDKGCCNKGGGEQAAWLVLLFPWMRRRRQAR